MRTETITRSIFTFDELSDSAKDHARNEFRSDGMCWGWGEEWEQSLAEFERRVGFSLSDRRGNSFEPSERVEAQYPDWTGYGQDGSHMSGVRLWRWLMNGNWQFSPAEIRSNGRGGCSLTGYCGDCPFFDVFVRFLDRPWDTTLPDLLYESVQEWEAARDQDEEYSHSDEAVDASIEVCEYEFTEDGDRI